MTDAKTRRRHIDLSVIAVSALVAGASTLVVADVDAGRPRLATPAEIVRAPAPAEPVRAPALASRPAAPAPGLVPAPKAARRVVVVRRSRPS